LRARTTKGDLPGFDYYRFAILERKGDWLHVAKEGYTPSDAIGPTAERGWVKMHDSTGHLTVWLVSASDMEYR
jgi:hypothetical protein